MRKRELAILQKLKRELGPDAMLRAAIEHLEKPARPAHRPKEWDDFLDKLFFVAVEAIRQKGFTKEYAKTKFSAFTKSLPEGPVGFTENQIEKAHARGRLKFDAMTENERDRVERAVMYPRLKIFLDKIPSAKTNRI